MPLSPTGISDCADFLADLRQRRNGRRPPVDAIPEAFRPQSLDDAYAVQEAARPLIFALAIVTSLIAAILMLALGVWMFFALRARSRWNGYLNALRSEPGVVVVSTGRAGAQRLVSPTPRIQGVVVAVLRRS